MWRMSIFIFHQICAIGMMKLMSQIVSWKTWVALSAGVQIIPMILMLAISIIKMTTMLIMILPKNLIWDLSMKKTWQISCHFLTLKYCLIHRMTKTINSRYFKKTQKLIILILIIIFRKGKMIRFLTFWLPRQWMIWGISQKSMLSIQRTIL